MPERKRLTDEQYQLHLIQTHLIWRYLDGLDCDGLIERMERASTLGPILDPSLFREKSSALDEERRVVGILRDAQARIRAALKESR